MKVIFTWMEGRSSINRIRSCLDDPQIRCCGDPGSSTMVDSMEKAQCPCECRTGKRKHLESSIDVSDTSGIHPINEILLWHKAIKRELNEIAKEARKIERSGNFTNLSASKKR